MLTALYIRDFVIIHHLELTFEPGLCVLTGETGAGKSILVDALGLLLGDRAGGDFVRVGTAKAELSAHFAVASTSVAAQWLAARDLADPDTCLLRRVLFKDGRSRAFINGAPVPLSQLRELGEMLVDIHGQHEHQSLMRRDVQRQLLDACADNEAHLAQLLKHYQDWRRIHDQLAALDAQSQNRQARLELLRYQVAELDEARLEHDEGARLDAEQRRLANAERIRETCQAAALSLDDGEDALYTRLGRLLGSLKALGPLDTALQEAHDLLAEAQVPLREAAHTLYHYAEDLQADPARLQWLDARLCLIHELARKHRVASQDLPEHLAGLSQELATLTSPAYDRDALAREQDAAAAHYHTLALEIRTRRRQVAEGLSVRVTQAMQQLGMSSGHFAVVVDSLETTLPAPTGLDRVEFQVTANPGQPLRPLSKVASGGELSRISLAIQMIGAQNLPIPTLVFDEVDSGIGGAIAEIVGRQLHGLGRYRQVLCVTHLPQVAAQADHHYRVNKQRGSNRTTTMIEALDPESRVREIARMLGGIRLTHQSIAHAREMIAHSQVEPMIDPATDESLAG